MTVMASLTFGIRSNPIKDRRAPMGNCPTVLSPSAIEWKKLHSKTIPTEIFQAGNKRFSIPIGISIEIFIPTEEKSSTGVLKQGCLVVYQLVNCKKGTK